MNGGMRGKGRLKLLFAVTNSDLKWSGRRVFDVCCAATGEDEIISRGVLPLQMVGVDDDCAGGENHLIIGQHHRSIAEDMQAEMTDAGVKQVVSRMAVWEARRLGGGVRCGDDVGGGGAGEERFSASAIDNRAHRVQVKLQGERCGFKS